MTSNAHFNAAKAASLAKEKQEKEAEAYRLKIEDGLRREEEAVANARQRIEKYFSEVYSEDIRKRAEDGKRTAILKIWDPEGPVGVALWEALKDVLRDRGFHFGEPEYHSHGGHDGDTGHYDFSFWSVDVNW